MDFSREILASLEKLFVPDSVQTLVFRADDPNSGEHNSAIKVVHVPSGAEAICDQFNTQIENKAAALARLASQVLTSQPDA